MSQEGCVERVNTADSRLLSLERSACKVDSWLVSHNLNFGKVLNTVIIKVRSPQDHPQGSMTVGRTDRTQHRVVFVMIYHSKRIQSKVRKGKNCKRPGVFKISVQVESFRMCLVTAVSRGIVRLTGQGFYWRLVIFLTPTRKAGVQHCLIKQFKHSEPLFHH